MLEDREYSTHIDGKWVKVPPIDDLCLALKEKFIRQLEDNQRLQEENKKLKEGIWEKEEVARLKADYERMKKEYYRGFPISEDEWLRIQEWQKQYIIPNTKMGAIEGMFTYKFFPTSIGVSGKCIAPNGDEFEFCELG